ncbi:MAG: hypothetical protein ACTSO4_11440 [Promethearchaeota archaeon]
MTSSGIMEIEHLKIKYLEGRTTIHSVYYVNPKVAAAAQATLSRIYHKQNLKLYSKNFLF